MVDLPWDVDNASVFGQLWNILGELRQKLAVRFELHPDPSRKHLQVYSAPGDSFQGMLNTFSGPEIDWLVHAWLGNPKSSFSTMGLTTWLGPHIRIPHIVFEFVKGQDIFFHFYMDCIPRTDLSTDLEYLDRYYEPANQIYLALRDDSRLSPYISKSPYIRQVHSPISLCYTCQTRNDTIELVRTVAHEMMERWLTWVDEAEPVPEDERAALTERDLFVRRTIAERDPGNEISVRLFGAEFTNMLVRALWGGDRVSA